MATELTPEQQFELVYNGIVAVAAHCDGARSLDYQGFDGQDTHYGRRVASVPFSQWTGHVMVECARIASKYQKQILAYTGVDMSTLPVVQQAVGRTTNHEARNQARAYEKRAKHLAARQIDVAGKKLTISWANGDPDFKVFLPLVQALPGRHWTGRTNEVLPSPQVEVFINEHDFTITPAAQALLAQPAPPVPVHYDIGLEDSGNRVFIKTNLTAPGQPAAEAVKALPGRSFDRSRYANTAALSPQVVAFAATYGLNISPEAKAACEGARKALEATEATNLAANDWATITAHVSSLGSPEELPAVFVNRVNDLLRGI